MPGFAQTASEALQVGFGAAGVGMTAADEADREAGGVHLWQHAGVLPLLDRIPNNNDKAMVGDTLKAPPRAASTTTAPRRLPKSLLYSIFARIGGSGLDTDAFETLRASYHGGFLGKAVAYDNRQTEIPATLIHSLRWHPVRLLSSLDSPYYYGAKKKYLDWIAARQLATGRYDMFHSWSGDCLLSLREARKRGIPSILEIPTWHRDRGKVKRGPMSGSPETRLPWRRRWKEDLLLQRDRFLEEYDLADLLLVLSEKAAETFRVQGFSNEKLFYLPRGVDVDRFTPGVRPPHFRAVFSGALIERKGVHHLLEAWHRLDLKDAELWLVGAVHAEMKPFLEKFAHESVKVIGFAQRTRKISARGDHSCFSLAVRRQRQSHLRGGGLRSPAGHDARSGRRGRGRRPGDHHSAGGCRCARGGDSAALRSSGNRETDEPCGAGAGGEKFHVGPFPRTFARRLRTGDAEGALAAWASLNI